MTKEERENAIRRLQDAKDGYKEYLTDEALDAAIDGLEQYSIIDKIRAEFIEKYPKNYAGGFELGGRSCVFSLVDVLAILDKYDMKNECKTEG